MKISLHTIWMIISLISSALYNTDSFAQCGAGLSQVAINWDYQYYRNNTLPPSGINYMMGKNTMTMTWASATFDGVVNNHTNHTGSFGTGNDARFTIGTNGTVTFTFLEPVENLRFTVYDIDNGHTFRPTATNASGTPINVTLARAAGGTLGTLGGTATAPTYTYGTGGVGLTSNVGAINVTVAGPVKTMSLRFTKSSGSDAIYISDISACTNSTWSTDYQSISAPETGQPTHMLVSYDSIVYVVNKLDNTAMELFSDPTMNRINTMAYDPYKQVIYYCNSARSASNRSVYKYDVKSGVKSTFISDVNTLGMQTFSYGLATGGASFYDGYLFLGTDNDLLAGTPVAVYRIDIDAITGAPIRASRFWGANSAVSTGGGGVDILYDWGDFVLEDGVLFNFNGASDLVPGTALEHFNLNLQTKEAGYSYSPDTLSQASLDYEGNIFSVRPGFYYQQYNRTTGTFGPRIYYSGIDANRLITDGAESFKYPYDYGDAPSSYGYASHVFRVSPNLMIGTRVDYEMKSFYSSDALADDNEITATGNDEDGVNPSYFTSNPISASNASYSVPVSVRNATGANAYMYAYIDFNVDGDFNDVGERSQLVVVPNGATSVVVTWTGLTAGAAGNSYIRLRIASDVTEISTGNGYSRSGEVEDYPIIIQASSLPVELVSFTGKALENNTTQLNWSTASEFNNNYFEVQRSADATVWEVIGIVEGKGNSNQLQQYAHIDEQPLEGINYYRLKQVDFDGKFEYSSVVYVRFNDLDNNTTTENEITVYPNPTVGEVWVKSNSDVSQQDQQQIDVYNVNGQQIYSAPRTENTQKVDFKYYENGMYYLRIGNQSFKIIKN